MTWISESQKNKDRILGRLWHARVVDKMGDDDQIAEPCLAGHRHQFAVAVVTDDYRFLVAGGAEANVFSVDGQWADTPGAPRAFVCVHCRKGFVTESKAQSTGAPHRDSYRPDLPLRTSDASVLAWATSVMKKQEKAARKVAKIAEPETIVKANKPHPNSYRPDLPLGGFTDGQLTRVTKEDRAYWTAHPLSHRCEACNTTTVGKLEHAAHCPRTMTPEQVEQEREKADAHMARAAAA